MSIKLYINLVAMAFNTEVIPNFMPIPMEETDVKKGLETSITKYNETLPNRPNKLLIPGIVPKNRRCFSSQINTLKSKANLCGIDYAQKDFSIDEVESTILKSLFPMHDLTVVATSFGTRVICDILSKKPELARKIKNLVLLGPFFQLDKKGSTLSLLKNVRTSIPLKSLGFIEEPLVQIARSKFNYDPGFYTSPEDRITMIEETDLKGLGARMNYFAKPFNFDARIDTPTTIVWWEREPASEEQKGKIEEIFHNPNTINLHGKHGYIQSQAHEISHIIETVLNN